MRAVRRTPRPSPRSDLPGAARNWAYFFDLDGTLVDFADAPSHIVADSALRDMLCALHDSAGGAVAIITGRTIADIDSHFPALRLPTAGQHGLERRDAAGKLSIHLSPAPGFDRARRRLVDEVTRHRGLLLEDKGLSLALHYRQAPRLASYAHRLVHRLQATLGEEYVIQSGKRVVELKPAGRDKGAAILEFMQETPFQGRLPVFIGDDSTDEFGFATVNRLGGHSVKVGPGATAAVWRLPNVAAVHAWLRSAGAPGAAQ